MFGEPRPSRTPRPSSWGCDVDGDHRVAADRHGLDILALPSPDWLYHRLTVTGPVDDLARFNEAAAGPGVVPWRRDYDALVEHLVILLIRPDRLGRSSLAIHDARLLAGKMRDIFWRDDQLALEHYYRQTRRCPFDLHRLVPVPDSILTLGSDAAASMRWMWEHWGTTWSLRRVCDRTAHFRVDPATTRIFEFWSADWTPWRAVATIATAWPHLTIVLRPYY
ncbi:hypothetical protein SAMN02746095_03304 [Acidocella aminolytica 101 = DSM 11237]|nr:hypothetical protein SAMN02746095_03304 [Acidocella aminolytica 101 = DSM 11237]